jgi:hypothetical protein
MSDIFISYSTKDGIDESHQLVAALEDRGLRCWIAPRDVKPGGAYPDQIVRAIRQSSALVLLLTPGVNESRDVLEEVRRAHDEGKLIVPLIVRDTPPSDSLSYFLGARPYIKWTDAKAAAAAVEEVFEPTPPPSGSISITRLEGDFSGHPIQTQQREQAEQQRQGPHIRGIEAPPGAAARKSTTPSRAYGCAAIVVGALALAIGGFALMPRTGHNQREILAGIRGTWAPQKQDCGGRSAVKYDFAGDEKEATISQGDELIGRVVTAQGSAIVVYRTVGGVREQWEFELEGDRLHVTHGRTETTLIRCTSDDVRRPNQSATAGPDR